MHPAEYDFWIIVIAVGGVACLAILGSWLSQWSEFRRTRQIRREWMNRAHRRATKP